MSAQLTVPALDSAGLLHRWLITAGESVMVGQPVAIIVTETQELAVPSSLSGTIATLLVEEGAPVESASPLATLADSAQSSSIRSRVTPVARRIAAIQGIDLATLQGSGVSGTICKRDVVALLESSADRAPAGGFCVAEQMGNTLGAGEHVITVPPPASRIPIPTPAASPAPAADPRRSTLMPHSAATLAAAAEALASNQHIPSAISAIAVDMAAIEQFCRQQAATLARRGVDLTTTACLALATLRGLSEQRHMLASWGEEELIQRAAFNLAVVQPGGAMVLANAADLSLQGIARALTQRQGAAVAATFTLAHSDSSWWSGPLVALNQAAVLHVGATSKQVVVQEHGTADQALIRPVATLTLAYDPRMISDAAATAFLRTLRHTIEHFTGA
jgi:pyruvate/2-oxoglutarate dehydrogenase complex dihydrolipoamide acyltransferase (E2) component